jgi:hypothetical protein
MRVELHPETICRVIELLKFSDWSYRAIARDAGCSTTMVENVAQGHVPRWFLAVLSERHRTLLDTAVPCPHCAGRVQLWAIGRGRRVARRLGEELHEYEQQLKCTAAPPSAAASGQ